MLIIIDTETTGLAHEPDARPWQIAAVVIAPDGREIAAFDGRGCPDVWNAGADEALAYRPARSAHRSWNQFD